MGRWGYLVRLGRGSFMIGEHDEDLRVGRSGNYNRQLTLRLITSESLAVPIFSASRSRTKSSSENAQPLLFPATSATTEPSPDAARTRMFLPVFFPNAVPDGPEVQASADGIDLLVCSAEQIDLIELHAHQSASVGLPQPVDFLI